MSSTYKGLVEIDLDDGEVNITVSGEQQDFTFTSDLGSVILPQLFLALSSLYNGKSSRVRLSNYCNSDYYNFVRNSNNIRIEQIKHQPGGRDFYSFNLYMFVSTIDKAFSKLLRHLHREGILPLRFQDEEDEAHPLCKNVLDKYNEFSSIIRKPGMK
ncbi:hypothetical protein [Gottfriedia acidiceleris]|uniref:hypothetical protein n=1 Tax=Gottfriedia acidiceleris TaxID=371036 RepID=UPI00101C6ED4|nr:hypothetical protein [Gottfriedia acidiceleris]